MIGISNYYLCDYCKYQHDRNTDYEWTELCNVGETEPKVMYDHHGKGGKRYDEPRDVCEHFEERQ